jgi:hypothetical protein
MAHYQTIPDWNTTLNIKDMFDLFNDSRGVKYSLSAFHLLLSYENTRAA